MLRIVPEDVEECFTACSESPACTALVLKADLTDYECILLRSTGGVKKTRHFSYSYLKDVTVNQTTSAPPSFSIPSSLAEQFALRHTGAQGATAERFANINDALAVIGVSHNSPSDCLLLCLEVSCRYPFAHGVWLVFCSLVLKTNTSYRLRPALVFMSLMTKIVNRSADCLTALPV